ncbi:MAG TPA: pyridoxamine 5'-phosphate oxidase family protein [Acidimicrobiia bacterium]|jgi:nitroimidazol reductase NimA-like FMN-containing flavoprotein (pyridoxamine 5'-phosphate oxidase superfamily)
MEDLTPTERDWVLASGRVAHLGVVDGDAPYVTAVSYVIMGDRLVFRSLEGRRMRAIRSNPNVSVLVAEVDGKSGDWRSVSCAGKGEVITDPIMEGDAITKLLQKYASSYDVLLGISDRMPLQAAYVVAVALDEVTGRRSGSPLGPKTRPGRL